MKRITDILRRNFRNIPGWTTNRKIIVFESDDWGAIRMPSKKVYNELLKTGINVNNSYYNRNDSIESNNDLESLFTVLTKYKDQNNRHPVFTALSIMANPDFDKIESNNFEKYDFEPVQKTLTRYGSSHNNVINLWKEGIKMKVFHPEFHGREHLNVGRWMKLLQRGNNQTRDSFNFNFYGMGEENEISYLPAFDLDNLDNLNDHKIILSQGIELFKRLFDYAPSFFVAPNSLVSTKLESFLKELGIFVLSGARQQKEPLGNNKFKTNFRYTGKINSYKQIYTVRNSQFEHGHGAERYGWEKTMKDIENAFFWKKPAIISTHRVNYIGFINEPNRKNGMKQLDSLLKNILLKWPNVEFMTSTELGELIINEK